MRPLRFVSFAAFSTFTLAASAAFAQNPPPATVAPPAAPAPAPAGAPMSQDLLDSLLAPIALYPDQLLSQVLMASTYPLEVVEAARFFVALKGASFGRCDIRVDGTGTPFMLEINPNCGVYYLPADYGSADLCLAHDPEGHAGFTRRLIRAALHRHRGVSGNA